MQKTILITGSTDGIGLETAKMLVSQGHHVLLHGRNPAKLETAENALSALQGGGRIECRLRHDDRCNRIIATIVDSGPGIESQTLDRIFEPFFTTKAKGTGLGLAIAQRIVQAHEGHLKAYNADQQGAVFEIDLPFCRIH